MRIISQRCICPVCRDHFTAFLADTENPQLDEVDPSQRSLLCVVCERNFINSLYRDIFTELHNRGELPIERLRLSALLQEAQRAGESRSPTEIGTDQPGRVPAGLQGMSDGNGNTEVSHGVSGHLDPADETLRGPTLLPPDPVGE